MTEIDVVNDCLSTLGEAPVASLSDDHPFLPAARRALDRELTMLQAKVWWFNTEFVVLVPDEQRHVYVPADALRCNPLSYPNSTRYVQRGRLLYDTWKGQYEIDEARVPCSLVRQVEFPELPHAAQQVVALSAVLRFQRDYDADKGKTQEIRMDLMQATADLRAEHIRHQNDNFMHLDSVQSKLHGIFHGADMRVFPSVSGN